MKQKSYSMLDLVYVNIEGQEEYGLYVEPWEKDSTISVVFTKELMLIPNRYITKVDEAFTLLYDGHMGLGKGLNTKLHHAYDNHT